MSFEIVSGEADSFDPTLGLELVDICFTGDLEKARELVERGADAWVQAEGTGWNALFAAVYSGNAELVEFLLSPSCNAVWSMTDSMGYTAGDIAYSLNDKKCYDLILDEGVRFELLQALLRKMGMGDDSEEEEEEEEEVEGEVEMEENSIQITPPSPTMTPFEPVLNYADSIPALPTHSEFKPTPANQKLSTAGSNKIFLRSKLVFGVDEAGQEVCVDEEGNGVMMGWETKIMLESAAALSTGSIPGGFSVVNVGFGLGIIDSALEEFQPAHHLIIEPHPDVLAYARSKGWYEKPGVRFYEGTWQQFQQDVENGLETHLFDAVYFDTYSEHYRHLHDFFKFVPSILAPEGKFSFFHGLGATSRLFYDVYTQVSSVHLKKIGFEVVWSEVDLSGRDGGKGEKEWNAVERRYWDPIVGSYRLPLCTMSKN